MKRVLFTGVLITLLAGCSRTGDRPDASGAFEADEVIVSAEIPGKILSLRVEEGALLQQGAVVGAIDSEAITLQKEQVEASLRALKEKTADITPQVNMLESQLAVQQTQLEGLRRERQRLENLVKADAATGRQLDEMTDQVKTLERQMEVTRRQIALQRSATSTQNRSILSEGKPLQKRVAQLNQQISDASIINPVSGTVLAKYAEAGEMTGTGKALYKIANLEQLDLRAYITNDQFTRVKLGQKVEVLVDSSNKKYRSYEGTITWISDKAEFTPKTIQTRDERANLVYAIKVRVKNDGYLKIGMYGELRLP